MRCSTTPALASRRRRDISRGAARQFETNLFGAWELTARVLSVMRAQDPTNRVLFNSSVLGFAAMRWRAAPTTPAKYAMEGLADTLRLELAAPQYLPAEAVLAVRRAFGPTPWPNSRYVDFSDHLYRGVPWKNLAAHPLAGCGADASGPPLSGNPYCSGGSLSIVRQPEQVGSAPGNHICTQVAHRHAAGSRHLLLRHPSLHFPC